MVKKVERCRYGKRDPLASYIRQSDREGKWLLVPVLTQLDSSAAGHWATRRSLKPDSKAENLMSMAVPAATSESESSKPSERRRPT